MNHTVQDVVRGSPAGRKGDGTPLFNCPCCGGKAKLEFHPIRGVWHCHKCHEGGSLRPGRRPKPRWEPLEPFQDVLGRFQPAQEHPRVRRYLLEVRKLPTGLLEPLRPHRGPTDLRVYLPLYRLGGVEPVNFVGRLMSDSETAFLPRYWNAPLGMFPVRKSETVWGLHRVRIGQPRLVICEGVFDAIWHPDRVALLGKSLSRDQREVIRTIGPREVVILLDGDAPGEASRIGMELSEVLSCPIWTVRLPADRDPDSYGLEGEKMFRRMMERLA